MCRVVAGTNSQRRWMTIRFFQTVSGTKARARNAGKPAAEFSPKALRLNPSVVKSQLCDGVSNRVAPEHCSSDTVESQTCLRGFSESTILQRSVFVTAAATSAALGTSIALSQRNREQTGAILGLGGRFSGAASEAGLHPPIIAHNNITSSNRGASPVDLTRQPSNKVRS